MKALSTEQIEENKQRLEEAAQIVTPCVSDILGHDIDLSRIPMSVDDGNIFNDTDMTRARDMTKKVLDEMTFVEKVKEHVYFQKIKGVITRFASNQGTVMKYNDEEGIALNPRFAGLENKTVRWLMAHEIVHPSDDYQYGFSETRFDILGKILELALAGVYERHAHGKSAKYRALEEEAKAEKKVLENHMTVVESHANYVQEQYLSAIGKEVKDVLCLKLALASLKLAPLAVLPSVKQQAKRYKRGKSLVAIAYKEGISMGNIYANLPREEDFGGVYGPLEYFKRIGAIPKHESAWAKAMTLI